MTADLPVQDLIAEAVASALPASLQPVGAGLRYPPEMGGELTGYGQQIVEAVVPAVVAAVQGATVEQQRDLLDGEVERARFDSDGDYYRHAVDAEDEEHLRQYSGTIRSRLVGPWREDPA